MKIWSINGLLLHQIVLFSLNLGLEADDREDEHIVNSAYFSPDGKSIVTAGYIDDSIRIFDAGTGERLVECVGHEGGASSAAYSSDGKLIVSAGVDDYAVKVWNADNLELVAVLKGKCDLGHKDVVWCAEFSPDGTRVVTASEDRMAFVWDFASQHIIARLYDGGPSKRHHFRLAGRGF